MQCNIYILLLVTVVYPICICYGHKTVMYNIIFPYIQSEILEKSLVQNVSEGGRESVSSNHTIMTYPTSASAIEQLKSLVKQREGELANAQVHISRVSTNISIPLSPPSLCSVSSGVSGEI